MTELNFDTTDETQCLMASELLDWVDLAEVGCFILLDETLLTIIVEI